MLKKTIASILSCVLLLMCPYTHGTAEPTSGLSKQPHEKAIKCNVTAEESFAIGEIMVGIKNSYSEVNKKWQPCDFPELKNIKSIEDLTYAENEAAMAVYEDLECFHQLLKITITSNSKEAVIAGIAALEENVAVLCAEPNYIFEMEPEPEKEMPINSTIKATNAPQNSSRYKEYTNDEKLLDQTGLFLHNVDKVWNAFTKGSPNVVVGIIDEGIYLHEDLAANLTQGYIGETQQTDSSYSYSGNHGTGVASIVGAKGNNGKGITGVCQNVTLKSLRMTNVDSNNTSFNASAYANCYLKASVDKIPIVVCCVGWGGTSGYNVIRLAMSMYQGLIVLASGNSGIEISASNPCYPDYYDLDNMIIVGGVNSDGTRDTDTNYSQSIVDLMALSNGVYACNSPLVWDEEMLDGNKYSLWYGSSVAAPFVAGTAALLLSYDSSLTTEELKQYICEGARTSSGLTNYCATGGYLDAYGAFLAMKASKAKDITLQVRPYSYCEHYEFNVLATNAYSLLSEIIVPSQVRQALVSMNITPSGSELIVEMDLAYPLDSNVSYPLIEFHYISYASVTYAKAYVGMTTTNLFDWHGNSINDTLTTYKYLVGDVNSDNLVNANDQLKILQYIGGTATLTGNNLRAADVDSNLSVNATDAMRVGQYSASTILSFY